jgi:hypothetical protein
MLKYVYIAGPYRGKTHDYRSYFEIQGNIRQAEEAFAALAQAGIGAFCPHTHSAHFEIKAPDATPEYWYELDMKFLAHCDAILMLPGWEKSKGSLAERRWAINRGKADSHYPWKFQPDPMPVFYSVEEAIEWAAT